MSRTYLLAAAGLLLCAAAVIHFWGRGGDSSPRELTANSPGSPTANPASKPQFGLVPPLDLQLESPADPDSPPESAVSPFPVMGPKGYTNVRIMGAINYGEFNHGARAYFDGHTGNVCASGCAYNAAPTPKLSKAKYRELLEQFAREPMDATSFALESLLYYNRQTRLLMASEGTSPLDPAHEAFLRRELQKTHAYIEIRMVDEFGVVRTSLPPTWVPLDRRHLFDMDETDLQDLETSGTVKRVGLDYLWTRL